MSMTDESLCAGWQGTNRVRLRVAPCVLIFFEALAQLRSVSGGCFSAVQVTAIGRKDR